LNRLFWKGNKYRPYLWPFRTKQ